MTFYYQLVDEVHQSWVTTLTSLPISSNLTKQVWALFVRHWGRAFSSYKNQRTSQDSQHNNYEKAWSLANTIFGSYSIESFFATKIGMPEGLKLPHHQRKQFLAVLITSFNLATSDKLIPPFLLVL